MLPAITVPGLAYISAGETESICASLLILKQLTLKATIRLTRPDSVHSDFGAI